MSLLSLLALTACAGGGASPASTVAPVGRPAGGAAAPATAGASAAAALPLAFRETAAMDSDDIVTAGGPSGFAGVRASFEHSLICDNGFLLANFAKQYGITTIFVPVSGDDVTSLLERNSTTSKDLNAMTDQAKVYLVAGDVSWLATPTRVPSDAASVATIAKLFPKVAGVLYDVDPEQSTGWNSTQRPAVMTEYFTLVQTLLGQSGAPAFRKTFFIAHTDWSTLRYGGSGGPTMLATLQGTPKVSGVDLIVPGASASAQIAAISSSLAQLTKQFWIEASTSPYVPQSYNGVSPSALASNLTQLAQTVSAQNGDLLGIEVNGWNDLYNSLQSVLPQPPVFSGTLASGPLVPPAGTAYLGASVNPNAIGSTPAQTAAFEAQIGRKLAFNMHFYGFRQQFPGPDETDDVANGRIPVVAWNCGDSDASVAGGTYDSVIINHAKTIKSFKHTIFLRWFWEMNLDDTNNAPRTQCYDPATDLPGGYFSPEHYIAAWRHIHDVFVAQGVTNVVWLWCVANAHGGPSQYFPGDDYVDWVGMDDYDTNDVSMQRTFFIDAEELSQFQEKPVMITETGAHATNQPAFLEGGADVLKSQFPWVRAVGYLDAEGSAQDWKLTPAGTTAFAAFANSPYLSATAPRDWVHPEPITLGAQSGS